MAADGSVIIDVELKDDEFNRSLDKIETHGKKTAKAIADSVDSIKPPNSAKFATAFGKIGSVGKRALGGVVTAAKGMAVGIGTAAIALAGYTVAAIKGAEADEAQNKQLKAVAKSMRLFGKESGTVADRLAKLADKNELLVGVDAEIIKGTQIKLLTFKELAKTADELGGAFDRATMLAIDLASAGFGDATSNAVQLGKALNDPIKGITALNRSGINFTDIEKEKIKSLVESNKLFEAQEIILRAIEKQVGGTAAASVKASDQLVLMANAVGDAFGAAFLPVIRNLMPAIGDFVTGITPLMEDLGSAIADMIAQVGGEEEVIAAAEALGTYLGDALEAAAPTIAAAMNALLISVSTMIESMSEGITAVAISVVDALASNMAAIVTPIIGAMLTLLEELSKRSDEWLTPIADAALDIIILLVNEMTTPENVKRLLDAGVQLGKNLWFGMAKALGEGLSNWIMGVENTPPRMPLPMPTTPSVNPGRVKPGTAPFRSTAPVPAARISSTTINFNQPVQSYSQTVRAMRDIEIGLALP